MPTVGSNWANSYDYTAEVLHEPTSLDELRSVVAGAHRIRALGTRHAFNDLADSAALVSLRAMPPNIRIDAETETVTVGGGVRYGELGVHLQRHGWALRNLASLPHISVAGAVATGTHGSGDRNGVLARAVSGIRLVLADGDLLDLAPADERFDGAVVGLGALGVVAELTLDIEPAYEVRQDTYSGLSWDALLTHFDAIMSRAYSVSVFTRWVGEQVGTVLLKSRVDERRPPGELFGATPHDGPAIDAALVGDSMTPQGGVPGPWIDRLPHFKLEHTPSVGDEIQSEYLVPRRHAVDAIRAVRELGDRIEPHLHVTELRTMAEDSLWLSPAYGTDAVGIHFTWRPAPDAVRTLLPEVEAALSPFVARPHWGKVFDAAPRGLYPRMGDFVALIDELDPDGVFGNAYLRRNVA